MKSVKSIEGAAIYNLLIMFNDELSYVRYKSILLFLTRSFNSVAILILFRFSN